MAWGVSSQVEIIFCSLFKFISMIGVCREEKIIKTLRYSRIEWITSNFYYRNKRQDLLQNFSKREELIHE